MKITYSLKEQAATGGMAGKEESYVQHTGV